jgi:hypothetical protein
MGGLSLRRRLPHRRTSIGGGWPSQTTWKGHLAPRMVAWPRQSENRQAVKAAPRLSTGNGAHPPEGVSFRAVAKQRVVARPDGDNECGTRVPNREGRATSKAHNEGSRCRKGPDICARVGAAAGVRQGS